MNDVNLHLNNPLLFNIMLHDKNAHDLAFMHDWQVWRTLLTNHLLSVKTCFDLYIGKNWESYDYKLAKCKAWHEE